MTESAFTSDELLVSGIAFATQNNDFVTSVEEGFDEREEKLRVPTQLLFASSMNDTECLFYKKFQDYAIKMFAGDKRYFVTSMPCTVALNPFMDGIPFSPLLKQSQIDDEMKVNETKARREYYNEPRAESETQMVKSSNIIKNSTYQLPILTNTNGKDRFIIALDPARIGDGSIISVMRVCHSPQIGYYGEICNCFNMIDTDKKKKMSISVPEQAKKLLNMTNSYNGKGNPDYQYVDVLMDAGTGGQSFSIADLILADWMDSEGAVHKGLVDESHENYKEEAPKYPNASRNFDFVNAKKFKRQMQLETIDLMELDLIKFTKEYDGKPYVIQEKILEDGSSELIERKLSLEERVALINIDAMKSEILGFNGDEKNGYESVLKHDDRAYTLFLLAHKLYEIRRKDLLHKDAPDFDWGDYFLSSKKK